MTFYFTNSFGKTKEFEPSHLSDMPGCVVGYELPENKLVTLHSSRLICVAESTKETSPTVVQNAA